MVMQMLNEDGSNKKMFNNIQMRKEERKNESIQVLSDSGGTVYILYNITCE